MIFSIQIHWAVFDDGRRFDGAGAGTARGIPFGVALGMPIREAVIAAILGNFIPVPFILLFIRSIFHWMKKRGGKFAHLVERLEARAI